MATSHLDIVLTEDEKLVFITSIAKHSVTCSFEGQELIVPQRQGRSVRGFVFMHFYGFKLGLFTARLGLNGI